MINFTRIVFLLVTLLTLSFSCNRFGMMSQALPIEEILERQEENLMFQQFAGEFAAKADSIVQLCHKRYGFQGNVLVSIKGKPVYRGSYGTADFRSKEELTKESIFQLASVSKQFTAMSILMLYEQGKLDLDDDVQQYIPQLPYEGITIRHLLNHTSGLPNYMWLVEHKWRSKEEAPYNDEVIDLMAKHRLNPYFSPGRRFNYSNTGYMVLAHVVEVVSGRLFGDFVHENIFQPLGMDNSYVYSRSLDRKYYKDHLMGHYTRRWRYRVIDYTLNDGAVGDKGVYSTIDDMYKWDEALKANKLISGELKEQAFTRAKIRNRWAVDYGFGYRLREKDGHKVVYHHGLWNGFRTSFVKYPSADATLIVLNHTNSLAKNTLANKLEHLILQETGTSDILLALADVDAEE